MHFFLICVIKVFRLYRKLTFSTIFSIISYKKRLLFSEAIVILHSLPLFVTQATISNERYTAQCRCWVLLKENDQYKYQISLAKILFTLRI